MAIAFFDIEGTVMDGDMSRSFIRLGRERKMFERGAMMVAMGNLLAMRVAPQEKRQDFRWRALLTIIKGHTRDEVLKLGRDSVVEIRPLFKKALLDKIAAHRKAGDTVVLISGGMNEAAEVIAGEAGANRGEGTRCEIRNGHYTGRLDGAICTGEHKAARARQVAAELGVPLTECIAYGDSRPDIPLLLSVGRAYAVDPDQTLAEEARRRGWEIINTKA